MKATRYGAGSYGRRYMPRHGKAEYNFPVMRYLYTLDVNNTQKLQHYAKSTLDDSSESVPTVVKCNQPRPGQNIAHHNTTSHSAIASGS
jgi:hypothetical protein